MISASKVRMASHHSWVNIFMAKARSVWRSWLGYCWCSRMIEVGVVGSRWEECGEWVQGVYGGLERLISDLWG